MVLTHCKALVVHHESYTKPECICVIHLPFGLQFHRSACQEQVFTCQNDLYSFVSCLSHHNSLLFYIVSDLFFLTELFISFWCYSLGPNWPGIHLRAFSHRQYGAAVFPPRRKCSAMSNLYFESLLIWLRLPTCPKPWKDSNSCFTLFPKRRSLSIVRPFHKLTQGEIDSLV